MEWPGPHMAWAGLEPQWLPAVQGTSELGLPCHDVQMLSPALQRTGSSHSCTRRAQLPAFRALHGLARHSNNTVATTLVPSYVRCDPPLLAYPRLISMPPFPLHRLLTSAYLHHHSTAQRLTRCCSHRAARCVLVRRAGTQASASLFQIPGHALI